MKEMNTKGDYISPKIKVLELKEDVVRTSDGNGAKISWDGTNWGEQADFMGGEF